MMVSLQGDDGLRTTLSDWDGLTLSERTPAGHTETRVDRREVPEILAARFGLEGFALSEEGRLRPPTER